MPQESVGRAASSRRPALVFLVGLVLTLTAHLVACAVHAGEDHGSAVSAASHAHGEHGAGALAAALITGPACSVTDDGHSGHHHVLCCDPADVPVQLRPSAGTVFPAFLLLALLPLGRRRPEGSAASGTPPGGGDASGTSWSTGPALLRVVCVSRT
ncbi:hypothetical protein ABZ508_09875 [Streptomyces lavendulocolor]|uniref:Secreted protein n=1 Tax=Streptomyces lavendulocolor TaxID=67316 RepID=A0ABV2W299_9ACTN|nr:hypothetical protein GCM10018771_67420 [Streptomyces cellulosae]